MNMLCLEPIQIVLFTVLEPLPTAWGT